MNEDDLPEVRIVRHDGLTAQQIISILIGGAHFNPVPCWLLRKKDGEHFIGLISGPFRFRDAQGQLSPVYNKELRYQNFMWIVLDPTNTKIEVMTYQEVAKEFEKKPLIKEQVFKSMPEK